MKDIAIIGIGCRFPGADGPEAFWDLLASGKDAISNVPPERWLDQDLFDSDPKAPGKMMTRWGGFLKDIDQFDANFFRISGREARNIDPQQRLLLEMTWQALEDAGIAPASIAARRRWERQRIGVYIGITTSDYCRAMLNDREAIEGATAPGGMAAVAANRISYLFDFHGPSMAIDTACSSSLVAIHQACSSLERGETDMCVAGGVQLLISPETTIALSQGGMMAADGRCKTFDAAADGYVRGEGAGIVILKKLADAQRDGDRIYAVIKGSAINQDGATNGLTAPSKFAQQAVLQAALRDAEVDPAAISLIEAHGTGTKLGDPIEVGALKTILMRDRKDDAPCWLGSVKTNIGHLESAAGIAGLIKTALCLHHRAIPPHLHLQQLNPYLPLADTSFRITQTLIPWDDEQRYAGVSAFGFGGANAHAVLGSAPHSPAPVAGTPPRSHQLLTLSAQEPAALLQLAAAWQDKLVTTDATLPDLACTSQTGREHFPHRLCVLAQDLPQAREALASFAGAAAHPALIHTPGAVPGRMKLAVLCTGQGAQYAGMGRQLYDAEPTFRATIDECDRLFRQIREEGPSLTDVLYGESGQWIDQTGYTQPALFAVEMALLRLWAEWGIKPAVLMGHSVGEYAAACAAGVFSLADGLTLIAHRGRLMQALPAGGKMLAVQASEDIVAAALAPFAEHVSIAARNGPGSFVIAGVGADIDLIAAAFAQQGVPHKLLNVSHAFHSPLMQPMLAEFRAIAAGISYHSPQITLVSNLTGTVIDDIDADYWCRQIRGCVMFNAGMQTIDHLGCTAFLEAGPAPVLIAMGQACLMEKQSSDSALPWLASIKVGADAQATMLASLARLHAAGAKVNWQGFQRHHGARRVAIPGYPFQRQRHWLREQSATLQSSSKAQHTKLTQGGHPLLMQRLPKIANRNETCFESVLSSQQRYLIDHQAYKHVIVPAAGMLEMAWSAAVALHGTPQELRLLDYQIQSAMILLPEVERVVQVVLEPQDDTHERFQILSRPADSGAAWTLHATGKIAHHQASLWSQPVKGNLQELQAACATEIPAAELYASFVRHGLYCGPMFQTIRHFSINASQSLAHMKLADDLIDDLPTHQLHPTILDGGFQAVFGALEQHSDPYALALPVGVGSFQALGPLPAEFWIHAAISQSSQGGQWNGEVTYLDMQGRQIARMEGVRVQRVSRETLLGDALPAIDKMLYAPIWQRKPLVGQESTLPVTAETPSYWLLLADRQGRAAQLAAALRQAGHACKLVHAGDQFQRLDDGQFAMQAGDPRDWQLLFDALDADAAQCRGILHLLSLDAFGDVETGEALQAALTASCASALHLCQALNGHPRLAEAGLCFITCGAQAVTDGEIAQIVQTPLWGLASVIAAEYPALHCKCIDLDPDGQHPLSALISELTIQEADGQSENQREDQVVLRQDERFVARLVQQETPPVAQSSEAARIKPDGTYVVTGGLGGLGMAVANWLAEQGARHLVLVGRHAPDEVARRGILMMEESGARVDCLQLDVARHGDTASLMQHVAQHLPPLKGVIHAAGVLDDGLLAQLDWNRFEKVMAPKVAGSWNLHLATRGMPLDFFIGFSSIAALFGSPGQANYVTANTFMDALAHYRHAAGMRSLSINWGPWADTGMASRLNQGNLARLRSQGIAQISPAHGLEALRQLMAGAMPQVGVMQIDWSAFHEATPLEQLPSRLRDLWNSGQSGAVAEISPFLRQLLDMPNDRRRSARRTDLIRRHVQDTLADILAVPPAQVDIKRGFFDMGMDSLMAVDLRNRLKRSLGYTLPSTLAFDYPTAEALIQHLSVKLMGEEQPEQTPAAAGVTIDAREPIAIIGMSCRLPKAPNLAAYWSLLHEGASGVTEVPKERWDIDAFYDADIDAPGKMVSRHGGFIGPIDGFDPQFFGISPREAINLDPQQRLLLEVSWEAIEDAGLLPEKLANTDTGVFVGIGSIDYCKRMTDQGLDKVDAYLGTGNAHATASGRISYWLDLKGPNLSVNTACSSSLVSVHLACQSLRNGESNLAFAGGVNLMITPEMSLTFSKAHMLAPDGQCKTFDAAADGYVRGEGCGVIILKRLSEALADGDQIHAVIRGSATNHGGRNSGLTVPNGPVQQAVIRRAIQDAGLTPAQIDYIEAHGTGTSLGDPIEIGAIGEVFRNSHSHKDPIRVGSVKTNFGHLETAAGIAGVIKLALSLKHKEIPQHRNFRNPSPSMDWANYPIEITAQTQPWPLRTEKRRGGVSSFGFSGTNAHIIIEEAPVPTAAAPEESPCAPREWQVLPLSARQAGALQQLAAYYGDLLQTGQQHWQDIAYSAQNYRNHFERRLAVVARDGQGAREALQQFAQTGHHPDVIGTAQAIHPAPAVAMLFTGQGSQYAGMGRGLYASEPVFREVIDRCDRLYRELMSDSPSLIDVLYQDESGLIHQTGATQPALFALEMGLFALWSAWGVRPHALLGHSVGEYAAACAAEVFSLEDGMKLITQRGRLMQALPAGGGMLAVQASEAEVGAAIAGFGEQLSIAACNGPRSCVIAGAMTAIESVMARLQAAGKGVKRLGVSHAFHSALMTPMLEEFRSIAQGITYQAPQTTLISNLTGLPVEQIDADYWCRHIRATVRFDSGMQALAAQDCSAFLEIGPAPVLTALGQACLEEASQLWCTSLSAGSDDTQVMLKSLARLYSHGVQVDWAGFNLHRSGQRQSLPGYPFQRQHYWIEEDSRLSRQAQFPGSASVPPAASDDGYFEVVWETQQVDQAAPARDLPAADYWLIFGDRDGLGDLLGASLAQRDQEAVVIGCDALQTPMAEHLLALQKRAGSCRGIVHLRSLDTADAFIDGEVLQASQRHSCGSVLALVQAQCANPQFAATPLWLVTGGAQDTEASALVLHPAQAPLWGLGAVIALEHPALQCRRIDVAQLAHDQVSLVAALVQELLHPGQEDRIVLRGEERLVARLQRRRYGDCARSRNVEMDPHASYLVTGGLGSLGLVVAGWLVDQGARHLVLCGRSAPGAQALASIAQLQAKGAAIHVQLADLASASQTRKLFEFISVSLPPLKGIVHAAGLNAVGTLKEASWARFETTFAPKVAASWNLHQCSAGLPLDFFVLFSSIASILGFHGQGDYVSANTFCDALAHHRRARGLTALSINWGPWAEVGMAADPAHQARLAAQGLQLLAPQSALKAMEQAMRHDLTQAGLFEVDWQKYRDSLAFEAPLLQHLWLSAAAQAVPAGQQILQQIQAAPAGQRRALLETHLKQVLGATLGLPGSDVDLRQGFFDMGMDSLMAIEVRNQLKRSLELALPTTLAFDYPTGVALLDYLAGLLLPAEAAQDDESELATISDDDTKQFLADLLAQSTEKNQ